MASYGSNARNARQEDMDAWDLKRGRTFQRGPRYGDEEEPDRSRSRRRERPDPRSNLQKQKDAEQAARRSMDAAPPSEQLRMMTSQPVFGRFTLPTGERRSARLNPAEAAKVAGDLATGIIAEDPTTALKTLLEGLAAASKTAAGGRRQRGGENDLQELAEVFPGIEGGPINAVLTAVQNNEEKIAVAKTIVQMAAYNAMWLAGDVVIKPTTEFLQKEIADPLLGPLGKLKDIGLGLAKQLVRVPITLTMLSGASVGLVLNVSGQLLDMFNTWGRGKADWMLSPGTAKNVAEAAVKDARAGITTAAVGVLAANQLGILPLSAVLAAILFSLQLNLGTGAGRAYVVSSFYTWYIAQPEKDQAAIKAAATQYANDTSAAAKQGAQATKDAAIAAATTLGPYLVRAKAGTGNAFKAVGDAIRGQSAPAAAAAAPAAAAVESASTAQAGQDALVAAAPAAAIAATEVAVPAAAAGEKAEETAANAVVSGSAPAALPPAAAAAVQAEKAARPSRRSARAAAAPAQADAEMAGKGRHKTKKRSMKRRVTRRHKARKYLAAPVFVY